MAREQINTGTVANDGTGDSLRVAGTKINNMTEELYSSIDAIEKELKMTNSLNRFKEFTYNESGDITIQKVWDSASKETQLYNIVYTYTLGDITNIQVERISDNLIYNKEYVYNLNGDLISINIL